MSHSTAIFIFLSTWLSIIFKINFNEEDRIVEEYILKYA